ncbi:secretory phospholipase A2 receptor-like [Acanthaster planci]|uniref:Secretory phospholipase A2 receptor-like n=1 Tax=Acanthaster planci TaxID=133434 RepID=A0A8B7Y5G1_ACAPL|nr:secretory phospholipase A2 receptor-like [Acanthaster planci]
MNYQFVLLFWSLLAAVSVDGCGVGWVQHNNLCYQVVAERADWLTARQNCHTKGGDLVVIPNQETASFLNETLAGVQGSHWIGLHTRSTSPDFVWVDDLTNVTEFSNWAPAQPNYSSFSSEECVYISSGSGLWYSASCDWLSYPYICQREMGILPKCDVGNGWQSHNGKCYKVLNELLKWQSAEESCASYPGGHLASATSHDDVMFITNMWVTSGSSLWIGLSDKNRTVAGDYVWSDGSTYTDAYTNWENSQPNNDYFGDGGDCAEVGEEGEWRIRGCATNYRYPLCAISEGTCAQGWHIVNGHCYQVNSYARKTWTDAKRHCEAQDGYLVTVQGSFETTLIQGFLPDLTDLGVKTLFIGISDQKEDGVFRWVDDAPTTYDIWAPSQPMNTNHTDCGYIFTGNLAAEWMTGDCFELGAYICEISAGVPVNPVPPEMETGKCEPGWALHGNFCYEFSLEKQTWADANTSCVNLGSQLASIHGDREQSFFSIRLPELED